MSNRSYSVRRLTAGGLLLGVAVLLPQVFHLFGMAQAGSLFLPMQLPALLAGLLIGPWYGGAIGALAPLFSFLLTGMPPVARLPFMVIELIAYGMVAGWLVRGLHVKQHSARIYAALSGAMLGGRIAYALSLWVAADALNIPCGGPLAALTATVTGVWGIVLQLVLIPPIWYVLKKRGMVDGLAP